MAIKSGKKPRAAGIDTADMRKSWSGVEDTSLYHTRRWRRLRIWILQRDPVCCICKLEASTVADHVLPVRLGGEFWDEDNLQGVCAPCHNAKSAKEKHIRK